MKKIKRAIFKTCQRLYLGGASPLETVESDL